MARRAAFLCGLAGALALLMALLAGCAEPPAPARTEADAAPQRIVSLDYCADQYVLRLADRSQILALSPDAAAPFSFMREAAAGLPTVRPSAEDVLVLRPDLVVRSYGGGPGAAAFFERAGVPVLQMGWVSSLGGEEAGSVAGLIREMGEGLGQSARGAELAADYGRRLAALEARAPDRTALYMTPAGVTSGPGSLVHQMLNAAGLANFEETPGWRPLPLERLAYHRPDLVAAAFFEDFAKPPNAWSAARHPVARRELDSANAVPLPGAWTACGGWFILDAVEALAEGAEAAE